MTDSAILSVTPYPANGISEEAQFVERELECGQQRLQESHYSGRRRTEVLDELCDVADECRLPNWDGYGAEAVSQDSYQVAYRFLEALPVGFPSPTIGAEPDGCLTLEWHRTPHHTVSVSVSPQSELHYSALVGPNRTYGTEVFFGDPPEVILDLIDRIQTQ